MENTIGKDKIIISNEKQLLELFGQDEFLAEENNRLVYNYLRLESITNDIWIKRIGE